MVIAVATLLASCEICAGGSGAEQAIELALSSDTSRAPIEDANVVCVLTGQSLPQRVTSPAPGRYDCDGPAGTYSLEVSWRGRLLVSRMVSVPEAGRCGGAETVHLALSLSAPPADAGTSGDAAVRAPDDGGSTDAAGNRD